VVLCFFLSGTTVTLHHVEVDSCSEGSQLFPFPTSPFCSLRAKDKDEVEDEGRNHQGNVTP